MKCEAKHLLTMTAISRERTLGLLDDLLNGPSRLHIGKPRLDQLVLYLTD